VHAKLVAKLDFVSVFGLNYMYVAALCAGVETTVRILMVNSCDSVEPGHGSEGQQFLPCQVRSRVNVTDPVLKLLNMFYCCFWGYITPPLNLLDYVYSVLFTSLL